MVQMFTEEGRKNKYASLYNRSTFVVASIHSLVFDTTSESAYVTKNIESHCPIVPLSHCIGGVSSRTTMIMSDLCSLQPLLCRHVMFFTRS